MSKAIPGTRLGPYELVSLLGAGGMGEVFKARDMRLDRSVAIKILPPHLTSDTNAKARFEREAKTIAALNHPRICTLHDTGHHDGIDFLVLELLEGETLAERLERGAIPLDQALNVAIEIADALDAAHRAGIIHRDLKPANVMLTRTGVKLLDFGLAKLRPHAVSGLSAVMQTAAPLTTAGSILGTLHYMAPEQLHGNEADARSDIFSFGAVLYEMLTGRRAFQGNSQASVVAAILEREPPEVTSLVPHSPPALAHILARCFNKDAERRWQTARDVRLEIEWVRDVPAHQSHLTQQRPRARAFLWCGWVAATALLITVAALLSKASDRDVQNAPPLRFSVEPPARTTFIGGIAAPYLALSADGHRVAFVPTPIDGRTLIWVRSFDSVTAQSLEKTDGASYPFWSPDGQSIAFFADGKLKVIDANGGIPHVVCDAPDGRGGAWGADGTIVFLPQVTGPLFGVAANGGKPVPVTKIENSRVEISHRFPTFLPGRRHFLFLVHSAVPEHSAVHVGSLDSTDTQRLNILGSKAVYSAGHVLFVRDRSLLAQRFDASRLQLSGEPVSVGDQVASRTSVYGDAVFAAAETGTLVYWNGADASTTLQWVDRKGTAVGTIGVPANHNAIALSPDERAVAAEISDSDSETPNIWLIDVANGVRLRFTSGSGSNWGPVWSPDGGRIAFGSLRNGASSVYVKTVASNATESLLFRSPDLLGPSDWSPDGKSIVLQKLSGNWNTGFLPLVGDVSPKWFAQSEFMEGDGRLSPDGRWIAFTSNESGTWDVYVGPFPSLDRKWRISPGGGARPRWRRDGRELFYVGADQQLMAVSVTPGNSTFAAGTPRPLFSMRLMPFPVVYPRTQYVVAANGDRFLVNSVVEPKDPTTLTVILNVAGTPKK